VKKVLKRTRPNKCSYITCVLENYRKCLSVCLFVCLFICLSARISQKPHDRKFSKSLCISLVAVARFSSDGVAIPHVRTSGFAHDVVLLNKGLCGDVFRSGESVPVEAIASIPTKFCLTINISNTVGCTTGIKSAM